MDAGLSRIQELMMDPNVDRVHVVGSGATGALNANFMFIQGFYKNGMYERLLVLNDTGIDPKKLVREERDLWIKKLKALDIPQIDIAAMFEITTSLVSIILKKERLR